MSHGQNYWQGDYLGLYRVLIKGLLRLLGFVLEVLTMTHMVHIRSSKALKSCLGPSVELQDLRQALKHFRGG